MMKVMKIVATIEARMTSTRLPGKVMMPVLGKPILYYLVERLKSVPSIDEIVLATSFAAGTAVWTIPRPQGQRRPVPGRAVLLVVPGPVPHLGPTCIREERLSGFTWKSVACSSVVFRRPATSGRPSPTGSSRSSDTCRAPGPSP